jgi:uncharacterized protein YxjI
MGAILVAPAGSLRRMDARFEHPHYVIRTKVFRLFGGAFHLYGPDGELVLYSEQARFRLKEDIRLFGSEAMTEELLVIRARQMIDISPTFDVTDSRTGQAVGSLRRRGLRSAIADEWAILDTGGTEVGSVKEDSVALALVRRFLVNLIPQTYHVRIGDTVVAEFRQRFNPVVKRTELDFGPDTQGLLDRRLGLAAGVLLSAIEGRQR